MVTLVNTFLCLLSHFVTFRLSLSQFVTLCHIVSHCVTHHLNLNIKKNKLTWMLNICPSLRAAPLTLQRVLTILSALDSDKIRLPSRRASDFLGGVNPRALLDASATTPTPRPAKRDKLSFNYRFMITNYQRRL